MLAPSLCRSRVSGTGTPAIAAELSMHDRWIHTNPRKIDGPPVVREPLDAAW
jgi:hypothetical protein